MRDKRRRITEEWWIVARDVSRAKQAPELLDLVQKFVNTKNVMRGYDLLEDSRSAEEWLAESGYEPVEGVVDRVRFERLLSLREGLRNILLSHNPGAVTRTGKSISELNEAVGSTVLGVGFDRSGQPALKARSTGVEKFFEDILSATIWAHHVGVWPRLKVCANEECRWAFYDGSKNRSGSWCVMEICGSRAKMRAYRERRSSKSS